MKSLADRFWAKVELGDECWTWTGARVRGLYGHMWDGERIAYAHRISWEMHRGPIPDGLWVLHHCDNPPCVNPDHLFLGDHQANVRDMHAKGRGNVTNAGKATPRGDQHWTRRMPERRALGSRQGQAKLTEDTAAEVFRLIAEGTSGRELARRFGVSEATISQMRHGRRWRHVR